MSASGYIQLDGDLIRYQSEGYGTWNVAVAEVRVIGEATNQSVPWRDDYFFCFATGPGMWLEASFHAGGRRRGSRVIGGCRTPCVGVGGHGEWPSHSVLAKCHRGVMWLENWLTRKLHLRKPKNREVQLTPDGVELFDIVLDERLWQFAWSEITEIVAFKVDAVVVDHICLGFRKGMATTLHVTDEETSGWKALNEQLAFRHGVVFEQWFPEVAFPAFAENWTVLWSRGAA